MNKQKTVDSKVLAILRECPETRYDDMQLILTMTIVPRAVSVAVTSMLIRPKPRQEEEKCLCSVSSKKHF